MLGNFHTFLSSADIFFQNELFQKIISRIPSQCQKIWIQILIWVQTVCRRHWLTRNYNTVLSVNNIDGVIHWTVIEIKCTVNIIRTSQYMRCRYLPQRLAAKAQVSMRLKMHTKFSLEPHKVGTHM